MDSLYSYALLISLLLGSTALGAALLARISRGIRRGRLVLPACSCAWLAVLVSFTVHLAWGHTPGSAAALTAAEFLGQHRGFVVAALLPALAILVRRGTAGDRTEVAGCTERDRS